MNISQLFSDKLVSEELGKSRDYGVKIAIPICSLLENNTTIPSDTNLPDFMISFYTALQSMEILWKTSPKDQATVAMFQNDPWIKANYLDKGYEWPVVHEMLSGFINIQKLEDLLNPEFCKEQGYYYKLKNTAGINPDDFLPFDICSGMTACLKKEDGKIADNVWLVITEDVDECLYDMNLSIEEYLNLAYQAKVFHHWQAIYLWKEKYERYELMKRFLPKMLPHVTLDLSAFGIDSII